MSKIQKTSRIICKVLSVLFWGSIVLTALVVGGFILIKMKKDMSGTSATITIDFIRLTLADDTFLQNTASHPIWLLFALLTEAVTLYVIMTLKKIFSSMAMALPFHSGVSKSIKKIAWAILSYNIVLGIMGLIWAPAILSDLDFSSLFSENVLDWSISYTFGGNGLILFVLLMLLSHIFEYGEELQKLSDETL